VRRAAAIAEGELPAARRTKLRARLAMTIPDDAKKLDRVTHFLGELVGAAFPDDASTELQRARGDQSLMRANIQEAFLDWLRSETQSYPVVLVLENMQWGDLQTLKLIDAALTELRDRPLMVLGLARNDVRDRFPDMWADRELLDLRLGPLTTSASKRLVRHVLGDAPSSEEVDRIVRRGEGNPFYLEELIRAVAEGKRGMLPDTVLGMAQSRLDAVSDEARRVLRAGSIYGERFWKGGVLALVGSTMGAPELDRLLEELERHELIVRRKDSAFPDEAEYAFRQALIRDAAYALLTDDDRCLGHRLAGEWLLAQGEPDWNLVAQHYERGGVGITSQPPGAANPFR
jgi:predicted ATPase